MPKVNKKELARRIANRHGYTISAVDEILTELEVEWREAVLRGEEVNFGGLMKSYLKEIPEKNAYDGLNKRHFIRPNQYAPKIDFFPKVGKVRFPAKKEEE